MEARAPASTSGLGLIVIRHARAGQRSEWRGDDRRRPLDERGREQAKALVGELADLRVTHILSSPYDRCVQTVEALASARGLNVELREELGEERQVDDGAALARELAGDAIALCVHGGLSQVAFGEHQKKGETLVVDRDGRVVERRRV